MAQSMMSLLYSCDVWWESRAAPE